MRFRIKISDIFTWFAILVCHLVCGFGKMKSPWKSYEGKKVLQREKARSPNDVWKSYLKTWDRWNSQTFKGHYSWTPQESWVGGGGGLQRPIWTPSCINVPLWPMAIKLNPSWKTEVSKYAWVKPFYLILKGSFLICVSMRGEVCGENATQMQVNSFTLFGVKAFYK